METKPQKHFINSGFKCSSCCNCSELRRFYTYSLLTLVWCSSWICKLVAFSHGFVSFHTEDANQTPSEPKCVTKNDATMFGMLTRVWSESNKSKYRKQVLWSGIVDNMENFVLTFVFYLVNISQFIHAATLQNAKHSRLQQGVPLKPINNHKQTALKFVWNQKKISSPKGFQCGCSGLHPSAITLFS